jgi:hypothetical protein
MLVVDALDEAMELEPGQDRHTLASLLASATQFPRWLRILVTSRPHPKVINTLRGAFTLREIDAEDARNAEDLRQYILGQATRPLLRDRLSTASVTSEELASRLVENCGGKFLFVVHAVRDLMQGEQSLTVLAALPAGMDASYLASFQRRFGVRPQHYAAARDLLGVMCAAAEPLSRPEVAEILDISLDRVRSTHAQLPDLLRLRGDRLDFEHVSLKEWLTQEEEGFWRAGDFALSLPAAQDCLRRWALRHLRTGTAHECHYLLRHLSEHLRNDAERRDVYQELLLERFEWSQERLRLGGLAALLEDIERLDGHPCQFTLRALVARADQLCATPPRSGSRRYLADWALTDDQGSD